MDIPKDPKGRGKAPRWSALIQQTSEAMFVLNAQRRLIFANVAWEQCVGTAFAEARGQSCKDRGLAPPKEVMEGHTLQIRRRIAGRWCDVLFVPWQQHGRVHVVLGKITPLPEVQIPSAPLPDRILQLRADRNRAFGLDPWLDDSPQARLRLDQIRLAACSTLPVLLEGPVGAGKEWLARTIHRASPRGEECFAALDAAVLPPDLVRHFLDRVSAQRVGALFIRSADRLRADEQRLFLARWDEADQSWPRCYFAISADSATWLPEFQHRIAPLTIRISGLKDRINELDGMLYRLLPEANRLAGARVTALTEEARTILKLHSWPRNLTELREVLLTGCTHARGSHLDAADLPLYLRQSPVPADRPIDLDAILEKVERRLIEAALEKAKQNKSKAADLLGIWRARLIRRVEQWGLE